MTDALVKQKLASIPEEYLEEVATFLDFLSYRISKSQIPPQEIHRSPGKLKGKVCLSEDFDAPLEDFKEYM